MTLADMSRHKETGSPLCWIYGECAIHVNNNCHVQVGVFKNTRLGMCFPKLVISLDENFVCGWEAKMQINIVLSKIYTYTLMGP